MNFILQIDDSYHIPGDILERKGGREELDHLLAMDTARPVRLYLGSLRTLRDDINTNVYVTMFRTFYQEVLIHRIRVTTIDVWADDDPEPVYEWIEENAVGFWACDVFPNFFFSDLNSATLFKLRWG